MDTELNNFMRLDFITLAGQLGFVRDERESSGRSHVLRSGDGDKLAAKERSDGSWCYFNVHDHSDRGCIVNLVQRCLGLSLGHARKWLREASGIANASFPIPVLKSSPTDAKKPIDHYKKSLAIWNAAKWEPEPDYLLSRGLNRETLNDPRFADCWRVNKHGTVLFPHYDRTGICGYEYRSDGFKGFGRDVHKGLWFSRNAKAASEIVVTESQIDAMSHFQLYGGSQGYVSHNGSLGALQIGLMEAVFVKAHERNATVIIATDNDQAGEDFYSLFQSIAPMELERLVPVGNDWNADLLDRLSTLHGGKVIKLMEPEPSAEPSDSPEPEPSETVQPEPEPEPSPAPTVDWTKIKLTCVWKCDGRMVTKCSKPDIYDHPNGKVAGCRNCGAIHQEHAAMTL